MMMKSTLIGQEERLHSIIGDYIYDNISLSHNVDEDTVIDMDNFDGDGNDCCIAVNMRGICIDRSNGRLDPPSRVLDIHYDASAEIYGESGDLTHTIPLKGNIYEIL